MNRVDTERPVAELRSDLGLMLTGLDLPTDHFLLHSRPGDDGVRALLHFLRLGGASIPGYDKMLAGLLTRARRSPSTNVGYLAWTDILSEVSAIYLLSKMGLELHGLEQRSPWHQGSKTCDIAAAYPDGDSIHFEVKHRGTEDAQWMPHEVFEAIWHLKYIATPQLAAHRHGRREFDCRARLPDLIARVENHISEFDRLKALGRLDQQSVPNDIDLGDLVLTFHDDERLRGSRLFHIDPIWAGDVESWLFERGRTGRDGSVMVPMVDAALAKGADYLICEVGSFSPLPEIVGQCFDSAIYVSEKEVLVRDPRMADLAGILLFRTIEDHLLVVNSSIAQPLRLASRTVW